jgi:hypothetical protein
VARLAEDGFDVTQSSVSRDLRELGVAKVAGRYVVPAPAPPRAPWPTSPTCCAAVQPAGPHLTVLLTETGAAQSWGWRWTGRLVRGRGHDRRRRHGVRRHGRSPATRPVCSTACAR